jgi:hypothetical protein
MICWIRPEYSVAIPEHNIPQLALLHDPDRARTVALSGRARIASLSSAEWRAQIMAGLLNLENGR